VTQSLTAKSKILGATLHQVDEGIDTGPIIAQVACSFPSDVTVQLAHRLSYIQKVWLTLICYENIEKSTIEGQVIEKKNSYLPIEPSIHTSSQLIKNERILNAYCIWIETLGSIEQQSSDLSQ
jgi:methionyl-tRNA formyltransferase